MSQFEEKYESMGLVKADGLGGYYYTDKYGAVLYTPLKTYKDIKVPVIAVFTGKSNSFKLEEFKFVSAVSRLYSFIGNEVTEKKLKESLSEIGTPIFNERALLNSSLSDFNLEIAISNPKNVPSTGDIYPQISVSNSYRGIKAMNISFGIFIANGPNDILSFSFRNKQTFGRMRQIHSVGFKTTTQAMIGNYINTFNENIIELIDSNLNRKLDETMIGNVLTIVDKLGKKKRENLMAAIPDLKDMNSWDLFSVILKFSTYEKNLNAKVFLENAAESVLFIPLKMRQMIRELNKDQIAEEETIES